MLESHNQGLSLLGPGWGLGLRVINMLQITQFLVSCRLEMIIVSIQVCICFLLPNFCCNHPRQAANAMGSLAQHFKNNFHGEIKSILKTTCGSVQLERPCQKSLVYIGQNLVRSSPRITGQSCLSQQVMSKIWAKK